MPLVFDASLAILMIAAAFGQWQRQQPAGRGARALSEFIAVTCPVASPACHRLTVRDGAKALGRWAFTEIADQLDRDGTARCTPHIRQPRVRSAAAVSERDRYRRQNAASRRRR